MKRAPHRRIFPNRYNGVGGHIERDEDPLSSARREILEETGLDVRDIKLCAVYNVDAGEDTGIVLFVFTAVSDTRKVVSDEKEGTLHWIPLGEVSKLDLVEDLPIIIPRVTAMKPTDAPLFIHLSYDTQDQLQLRFGE